MGPFKISKNLYIHKLSSVLWEIDPHYHKLQARGKNFPNIVVKRLLNFNKPSQHGHKVKPLSSGMLKIAVDILSVYVDRKYMEHSHMTRLKEIITQVCDSIDGYIKILDEQNERTKKAHVAAPDEYLVKQLKFCRHPMESFENKFISLKNKLDCTDFYEPVEINSLIDICGSRSALAKTMKKLVEDEFPFTVKDSKLFHFKLPSQGANSAVHFIWKEPLGTVLNSPEQI